MTIPPDSAVELPAMTAAKLSYQDYVEALYEMTEEEIPTQQARLAERLGVTPASVSEAVKRLTESGLVEDGEIVLTPEHDGARDTLARSRARSQEVAGAVRALDPGAGRQIEDLYAELERLVGQPAPQDEVFARLADLAGALDGVIGG